MFNQASNVSLQQLKKKDINKQMLSNEQETFNNSEH